MIDNRASDHLPVFLIVKKTKKKSYFREVLTSSYKDFDEAAFRADISDLDYNQIFCDNDPDRIWCRQYAHILAKINACCPLHTLRISKSRPKYLTDDILTLMQERDFAFKVACKENSVTGWRIARTLQASVARELRIAKRQYILRQLDLAKGDWKKFWHLMNSSFFPKAATQITEFYDQQKGDLLEGARAANKINYFCTVSVELSNKFIGTPATQPHLVPSEQCDSVLPLSVRRVTEQINQIDPSKSSGFVNLPAKLLKIALQSIPEAVTSLLNHCITKAVFPQSWKNGIVLCLPKSGDQRQITNLRPISLLPIIGKSLEIFLNETIMSHLEQNHLLDDRQMAFCRGQSAVACCLGLVAEIGRVMNSSHSVLAVFVDLTKAFNTVNHAILLLKMKNLGFSGNILSMLESYLLNRVK